MKTGTRTAPLLLLLLIGALVLAMTPSAAAEPRRADWGAWIVEMDQALARSDAPAASAAWREAYVAAHVERGWTGMIAVGDAAVRAGRDIGTPQIFAPRARRAYVTALLRARRQASHDGVLAAAAAFGRLGDHEVEQQAKSAAAKMEIRADARRRARAF